MQPHTNTQTLPIWRSQMQPLTTYTLTLTTTLTLDMTLTQNLTLTQNSTLTQNLTLTQIDFEYKGFIIKTLFLWDFLVIARYVMRLYFCKPSPIIGVQSQGCYVTLRHA